jgi:broad specificity phosphatase PhoE
VLTVLLTRHGRTDRSEPEQYLGQRIDVGLSAAGRDEAERLAARLDGVAIDRIVSSPLARTAETAHIVAKGRPVELDKRLAELDYGAWEGLTRDEIERRFPGEHEQYESDPAGHRVGGGESGRQVARRLSALLDALLEWAEEAGGGKSCLVVGHSSTNRILLAIVLGVPLRDYRRRFRQDWANLTVLHWPDRESGPLLLLANDLAHWRGISGATREDE